MPVHVFVSDVERIGDLPPPKAPASPKVTLGTATGEAAPPLLNPTVVDQQLTFEQFVTRGVDPAPVIVIHELTGPDSRQIALGGRALPFRGSLKFAGEMRVENTPYTGYPKVNQTVLGATEDDTEMNGEWHDRFLLDPDEVSAVLRIATTGGADGTVGLSRTEIRTARDLCILFDDVRRSGRLLRVSWMHLQRLGRLAMFEQDWQNPHDVKWRMKFSWVGPDDQVGLPSPTRPSITGLAQALGTGYTDVHQATNFDAIGNLDPTFADRVDTLVGKLQATISSVGDAAESRISGATQTLDAVRRGISLAAQARDQAQDIIDAIDATTASAMLTGSTVKTAGTDLSGLTDQQALLDFIGLAPGDHIIAACQAVGAVRAARAMKHIAARQRFQFLRSIESDVLAIVTIGQNEDLRDIARQWYGTPDDWDEIRSFNGLTSSTAPAGSLIFVPTQRAR